MPSPTVAKCPYCDGTCESDELCQTTTAQNATGAWRDAGAIRPDFRDEDGNPPR